MSSSEFPPNNEASKRVTEKNLRPVTTGATRRKKSFRKQFADKFLAGTVRTAVEYAMFEVALPAARDMVWEAVSEGFLRSLMFGDTRRRGPTAPQAGPTGHISYNRYAMGSNRTGPQRALSRQARSQHDFDEIILDQRAEATEVIDRLFDVVNQYGQATIADLYELVGLASTHTDHKWGWTDLYGAGVSRIRGGYLLDLPEPSPLD